jgi:hypothetical protein
VKTLTLPQGIPLKRLAPLFGLRLSGLRNAICAGRFPIPTYRHGRGRYAHRKVVEEHFAEKRAEGLATLADAATTATETAAREFAEDLAVLAAQSKKGQQT